MNLNSIMYIIEIERCGSINRAAKNLYISQSNLSSMVKELEDELGYKLFDRKSSGITLKPEGYLFLQSAKAIQVELEKIRKVPEHIDALVNISLSCTWSSNVLRHFIEYRSKNHPETLDSFKETGLVQNFKDVQENQYRLSIFYCFHSRTKYHQIESEKTNLEAEVIASHVPVVALVSTKHPLAKKSAVRMEDLYPYPLALFEDFEDEDWKNIITDPAHRSYIAILYLFDRGAITDAITSGPYISITKKGAVYNRETPHLVEIPIIDLHDDLDLLLLKRSGYELNRRENDFIQYLKNSYPEVIHI